MQVQRIVGQSSAIDLFPVLNAVDGYGFSMVVDVVKNSIIPDTKAIAFDTFELFCFMLTGLFGECFNFIIHDREVVRMNGTQVFFDGRLGEQSIHLRRLYFFKRASISP